MGFRWKAADGPGGGGETTRGGGEQLGSFSPEAGQPLAGGGLGICLYVEASNAIFIGGGGASQGRFLGAHPAAEGDSPLFVCV